MFDILELICIYTMNRRCCPVLPAGYKRRYWSGFTCWSGPSDVSGGHADDQHSQQDGREAAGSQRAEGHQPEEDQNTDPSDIKADEFYLGYFWTEAENIQWFWDCGQNSQTEYSLLYFQFVVAAVRRSKL